MQPLRRLKLAGFTLVGVVIAASVVHMVVGVPSIEVMEFVFSPWFVLPGFAVAWLLAPRVFAG